MEKSVTESPLPLSEISAFSANQTTNAYKIGNANACVWTSKAVFDQSDDSFSNLLKIAENCIDEKLVWITEDKISDLPEALGEQSLIQKTLLYQLSVKNILDSYLPNLLIDHREIFIRIVNEIDVDPQICLTNKKNDRPDPINRKKISNLISKANNTARQPLSRFLINPSIEWFTPEFITFLNAGSVRIKKDHEVRFPFLVCSQFQTSPLLKKDEKYLMAIVNCESKKLKSKLLETYIKNVALTLESAVKHQKNVVGASLVIKGRLTKDLLAWIRGSSPLDPSLIPQVEVIYGIPLQDSDGLVLPQEYLFTLKQGSKYRLNKNNSKITTPSAIKIYQAWQTLRPYVVVDQLINEAVSDSNNFISFIHAFWKFFSGLSNPQFDLPNLMEIKNCKMEEERLTPLVEKKVNLYGKKVEEEAQCKILARKNKAQKLLQEFNDSLNDSLIDKVRDRVKKIAEKSSGDSNLFYLDWSHIIYDALKNKAYDCKFENIQSITLEILNQKNVNAKLYRNRCILKLDDLSKKLDGKLRFHFSEKPNCIGFSSDYSNRLFNWTLLTIITIYMQLDEKKNNITVQKLIANFINTVFQSVSDKSNYSFFYQFVQDFKIAKKQYDSESIIALSKLDEKEIDYLKELKLDKEEDKFSSIQQKIKQNDNYKLVSFQLEELQLLKNILKSQKDHKARDIEAKLLKNKHEIVYEILDFFIEKSKLPMFKSEVLISFMNELESKLKTKQKEEKPNQNLDGLDNEEPFGNLFGNNDNNNDIEVFSQNNTMDEAISIPQKAPFGESKLVILLEETPLFDEISLNTIKSLLKEYEETFDTCELIPSNKNYVKLEKINNLISFYNNNPVWRYFYFFDIYIKHENIVKYIYAITEQGEIKIAHEPIGGDVSQRPCHSQLANGLGVKAAGELIFQYDDNTNIWRLVTINNGSGHYRPPAHICLPKAKEEVIPQLNSNISQDSISLLNSLKPGMTLASGWDDDKLEIFTKPSEVFIKIYNHISKNGKKVPYTFLFKNYEKYDVRSASVRGSFNNWSDCIMTEKAKNVWEVTIELEPSEYEFKYYIAQQAMNHQNKIFTHHKWVTDPSCPKSKHGEHNSILKVENPANTVEHIFKLPINSKNVTSVHLVGTFNDWLFAEKGVIKEGVKSNQYRMEKDEDGIWQLSVFLSENKYEFQYVVNGGGYGCWYLDETCEQHRTGEYTNSIIDIHRIEQVNKIDSKSEDSEEEPNQYFDSPISQPLPNSESHFTINKSEEELTEDDKETARHKFDMAAYKRHGS